MKPLSELDRNMAIPAFEHPEEIAWYNPKEAPFLLHGLYLPQSDGAYRRLPDDVARATNEGVADLSYNTAGGRVRFRTDSPYIAISARVNGYFPDHMPLTNTRGFDVYVRKNGMETYAATLRPSVTESEYFAWKKIPSDSAYDVTVNFPCYGGVEELKIGLKSGSLLEKPQPYAHTKPVVCYGSSITQGGCASRSGMTYESILSRMFDCDYINLGFSGNARGEPAIAQYMAGLDMSAFVCDYDHNAPNPEHLRRTHLPLYRTIRAAQPDLPILLVTRPDVYCSDADDTARRRQVVWDTYQTALAEGDAHVAFLDGARLFDGFLAEDCTVDGCHPTDLGFYRMAQNIAKALAELLHWNPLGGE